jgi:hypothetical protein
MAGVSSEDISPSPAGPYDPMLLVGGESEKELSRARRVMGSEWVLKLKRR